MVTLHGPLKQEPVKVTSEAKYAVDGLMSSIEIPLHSCNGARSDCAIPFMQETPILVYRGELVPLNSGIIAIKDVARTLVAEKDILNVRLT